MTNTEETETVTTWADGFGVWHARVDFPGVGYGPAYLDERWDAIRAKARRAIKREVNARQNLRHRWTCYVEVTANVTDSLNRNRSVTFSEKLF